MGELCRSWLPSHVPRPFLFDCLLTPEVVLLACRWASEFRYDEKKRIRLVRLADLRVAGDSFVPSKPNGQGRQACRRPALRVTWDT